MISNDVKETAPYK